MGERIHSAIWSFDPSQEKWNYIARPGQADCSICADGTHYLRAYKLRTPSSLRRKNKMWQLIDDSSVYVTLCANSFHATNNMTLYYYNLIVLLYAHISLYYWLFNNSRITNEQKIQNVYLFQKQRR
jgi:hypothetical protein